MMRTSWYYNYNKHVRKRPIFVSTTASKLLPLLLSYSNSNYRSFVIVSGLMKCLNYYKISIRKSDLGAYYFSER